MTEIQQAEVRVIPETKKLWVRCFDCHLYFPLEPGQVRWLVERAEKTADGALVSRVIVTDRNFLALDIRNMALAFRLRTYTARSLREKQILADKVREHGEVEVAV